MLIPEVRECHTISQLSSSKIELTKAFEVPEFVQFNFIT